MKNIHLLCERSFQKEFYICNQILSMWVFFARWMHWIYRGDSSTIKLVARNANVYMLNGFDFKCIYI